MNTSLSVSAPKSTTVDELGKHDFGAELLALWVQWQANGH
jgi:hypothetical protein